MELLRDYALVLEWAGILSVVTFIGSMVAIPWIISRLPANYFVRHRQLVSERHKRHPFVARLILVGRNTLGSLLLLAGMVMLVMPGQGVITILIGISFMDFPRKQHLVDYLIRRPRVVRLLNWIRHKESKPPFQF